MKIPVAPALANQLNEKLMQIEADIDKKLRNEMPSLCAGVCGVVLFYAYLYKHTGNEQYLEKMNTHFNRMIEVLEEVSVDTEYAHGITGVAWCIQHLINEGLIDQEYAATLSDFDELIFGSTNDDIKQKRYDFFAGLIGKGNYFLERYRCDPSAGKYLRSMVEELLLFREEIGNGTLWQDYYGYKRTNTEEHIVCMGLAHGLASILVFLSKVHQLQIMEASLSTPIKRLCNSIMAAMVIGENNQRWFPYHQKNGVPATEHRSRMAWCHGDPGIMLSLLLAARVTDDEALYQYALDHSFSLLSRKNADENGILDASLCHGSAGLSQIFLRVFEYTGRIEFLQFSHYWQETTLQLAEHDDGIAGFLVWTGDVEKEWYACQGFLLGTTGVGLSIISTLSGINNWDRSLLLS